MFEYEGKISFRDEDVAAAREFFSNIDGNQQIWERLREKDLELKQEQKGKVYRMEHLSDCRVRLIEE